MNTVKMKITRKGGILLESFKGVQWLRHGRNTVTNLSEPESKM